MSSAPPFWQEKAGWQAFALLPFSALYGFVASRRMFHARRAPVDVPVICIGNFTVGGNGKTPTAIAIAKTAIRRGMKPGIVTRGHGGAVRKPHLVDAGHDSASLVGDEPLLLAHHAPVAIARRRIDGVRLLLGEGCDLILMDDGFQSAQLAIDHAVMVVDAGSGLGNGHVIPGGPLRAPLLDQLRLADSLLRMGSGTGADMVVRMAARAGKPVFDAHAMPAQPELVAGKRVLAFAGIGNPQRFYDSLAQAGADVAETRSFDDHHPFKVYELNDLEDYARRHGLEIVTTEKDAVRLHGGPMPEGFEDRLIVFAVETQFDPADIPDRIIDDALASWRKRRFSV